MEQLCSNLFCTLLRMNDHFTAAQFIRPRVILVLLFVDC